MPENVMEGDSRTLLKHFCLEGTVLGLKYFYLYPDKVSRCFWAVTLILLVLFACNMTRLLYGRFDEMPTRITIENQYASLASLPYPAITICSPNQLTVSSMRHFNKTLICFWAVTLILLVLFACNMTRLLYGRFDEMPTRITIENQYASLASLPYPAITICSPNQLTVSSMRHFNKTLIDGNTSVNLDTALPQLLGFYASIKNIDNEELGRLQQLIDDNRYTVPEVMGLMPQDCDNFLQMCIFRMEVRRCRDLFRPVLTRQGLCCTFNSVYYLKDKRRNEKDWNFKPHMASMNGIEDSLRVVVDYQPEDALPRTLFHVGAIRVYFTDWTEFPSEDQTKLVYPRVEAFLAIHGTYTYCSEEVASLPPWSRQCLFANERRLQSFSKYHNSDCDHTCYIRAVERHCRCQPLYVPHVGTSKACDVTQIQCINQIKDLSNPDGSLDCDCPRDCESRTYAVDLILGNLRGLPYMTFNPYSNIKFNETTTIMQFFFPSSVYVKKKQETIMSLISLASNLGGIFGLCMGVSVVSVLEMLFYTRKAVQNYLRKRLRRALQRQVQQYRANSD